MSDMAMLRQLKMWATFLGSRTIQKETEAA
jgi:hypothetical protein